MARRAIELSTEGSVAMLVGAAHVPSFDVDGRIVPGINELLRRAGFRGTPVLRCGDRLCAEGAAAWVPATEAEPARAPAGRREREAARGLAPTPVTGR